MAIGRSNFTIMTTISRSMNCGNDGAPQMVRCNKLHCRISSPAGHAFVEFKWTTEETIAWLNDACELPQYAELFRRHHVTGGDVARIAAANTSFLFSLGVTNPVHRQKLQLKAMDLVLFGYRCKMIHSIEIATPLI